MDNLGMINSVNNSTGLQNAVSISILNKSMKMEENAVSQIVNPMPAELMKELGIGQNIDIKV